MDTAHGAEVGRAEQRMRLEQVAARAAEEFGVDAAALVAEYGPDVPVPVPDEEEPAAERGRRPGRADGAATARGTASASPAAHGRAGATSERPRQARPTAGSPDGAGRGRRGRTAQRGRREGEAAAGRGRRPAPAEAVRTIPYVRAEQEKRAATAQRQLDQLGKVNPLALEEFAALEERHAVPRHPARRPQEDPP